MKKLISLILAVSVLLTLSSCQNKSSDSSSSSIAEQMNISFKEANVTMAEDFPDIMKLDKCGNNVLIFGKDNNNSYMGYVTDTSFTDYRKFDFTPKDDETVISACMSKFGKSAIITYLDGNTMLYVISSEGDVYLESDIGEIFSDAEPWGNVIADGENFIIVSSDLELFSVDSKGNNLGEIDLKGYNLYGIAPNSEGIPTALLQSGNETFTAEIIDGKLGECVKCNAPTSSPYAINAGNSEYSLIANFSNGLYGFKDSQWIKLTDYMDNTFSAIDIFGIITADENEYAVLYNDTGSKHITLLSERDISEIKSKKIITLGYFASANYEIDPKIKDFNSKSDDYRIEPKLYPLSGDSTYNVSDTMREDILSGNAPDIIQNEYGYISVESFGARESIFVDLYELIDNDTAISRNDFVDGYLEAMDFHGKLLSISPCFTIRTMVVKDKYLGGLTEWSIDEMMNIIASIPDDMGVYPYSEDSKRTVIAQGLIMYNTFIDYEKAECFFDFPEFIRYIKVVQENELGLTETEFNALIDGSAIYFNSGIGGNQNVFFWNDNYLINTVEFWNPDHLQSTIKGEFNEPATIIGYPNDFSYGSVFFPSSEATFSILRSCENIDGAWSFIRDEYLSDEFYTALYARTDFPAIEKYLTEKINAEKEPTMLDTGGDEPENFDFWATDDMKTDRHYYDPFTDEEAEKYSDFIHEAAKHRYYFDNIVYNIIDEELEFYFEGERSAEDTAKIIQDRISIYLSEQYA